MRKLILDTETSGLNFESDRIIEVACLELVDDVPSGVKFHKYFSPGDIIISDHAEQIHGLNNSFLKSFSTFDEEISEFLEFISDSPLIIHNAQFDLNMINSALSRTKNRLIQYEKTICTLEIAKKKFPGSKNNLNALCRRFNISLEDRVKHGALTDCYLLLQVYIELIGGKQKKLVFSRKIKKNKMIERKYRTDGLPIIEVSKEEEVLHKEMVNNLGLSYWKTII